LQQSLQILDDKFDKKTYLHKALLQSLELVYKVIFTLKKRSTIVWRRKFEQSFFIPSNYIQIDTAQGADLEYVVLPFLKGYFTGAMGEIQNTAKKNYFY